MAQTLTNNSGVKTTLSSADRVKTTIARTDDVAAHNGSVVVEKGTFITTQRIGQLVDIDDSGRVNGSTLVYDEERGVFVASTMLENQTINGGNY